MVVIPVRAHLLTLTISAPEIVERPVRVGRETRMQRERVMRTREITTTRTQASLVTSFAAVNQVFGPGIDDSPIEDHYHRPSASVDHAGREALRHRKKCLHTDSHRQGVVLATDRLKRCAHERRSGMDHDVDAPPDIQCLTDERLLAIETCQVSLDGHRLHTVQAGFVGGRAGRSRRPVVVDDDAGPGPRQRQR